MSIYTCTRPRDGEARGGVIQNCRFRARSLCTPHFRAPLSRGCGAIQPYWSFLVWGPGQGEEPPSRPQECALWHELTTALFECTRSALECSGRSYPWGSLARSYSLSFHVVEVTNVCTNNKSRRSMQQLQHLLQWTPPCTTVSCPGVRGDRACIRGARSNQGRRAAAAADEKAAVRG